jgi:hypothetical protein
MGEVAGTAEDSMEGTEVGTMVVFVEDTGAEAFTRITGDFGDFL